MSGITPDITTVPSDHNIKVQSHDKLVTEKVHFEEGGRLFSSGLAVHIRIKSNTNLSEVDKIVYVNRFKMFAAVLQTRGLWSALSVLFGGDISALKYERFTTGETKDEQFKRHNQIAEDAGIMPQGSTRSSQARQPEADAAQLPSADAVREDDGLASGQQHPLPPSTRSSAALAAGLRGSQAAIPNAEEQEDIAPGQLDDIEEASPRLTGLAEEDLTELGALYEAAKRVVEESGSQKMITEGRGQSRSFTTDQLRSILKEKLIPNLLKADPEQRGPMIQVANKMLFQQLGPGFKIALEEVKREQAAAQDADDQDTGESQTQAASAKFMEESGGFGEGITDAFIGPEATSTYKKAEVGSVGSGRGYVDQAKADREDQRKFPPSPLSTPAARAGQPGASGAGMNYRDALLEDPLERKLNDLSEELLDLEKDIEREIHENMQQNPPPFNPPFNPP